MRHQTTNRLDPWCESAEEYPGILIKRLDGEGGVFCFGEYGVFYRGGCKYVCETYREASQLARRIAFAEWDPAQQAEQSSG